VLAQRAASEGPRWTRAVEDQSAPIPEEVTSKLGRTIKWNEQRAQPIPRLELGARRLETVPDTISFFRNLWFTELQGARSRTID